MKPHRLMNNMLNNMGIVPAMPSMPSHTSSIFATYMYLSSMLMLIQTGINTYLPRHVQQWIYITFRRLLFRTQLPTNYLTITITEFTAENILNEVYVASASYLPTKISPKAKHLCITKTHKDKDLTLTFDDGEIISDEFQGVKLEWKFYCQKPSKDSCRESKKFTLTFPRQDKNLIVGSYLPSLLDRINQLRLSERVLKMYTLDNYGTMRWTSINLDHPSNFDTLAMESSLKDSLVKDLDRFRTRKDYYKRAGRAWKRGYLLYGPPGTGKSSLVAAMANYLKYDIYDLQLSTVHSDSDLRKVLLATGNKSILLIEDIDCGPKLPRRDKTEGPDKKPPQRPTISLSGLLNFIDGIWSSCGDERIIVFTTNHKEKLDPALLRPGRMDMHVHLSYCTIEGFEMLVTNYMGVNAKTHKLYEEIGGLIEDAKITPAKIAEKLMSSEDPDVALDALMTLLKKMKMKKAEVKPNNDVLAVDGGNDDDEEDGDDNNLC
ncbi:AAA-ATPase At5g17760 [Linum perenne]